MADVRFLGVAEVRADALGAAAFFAAAVAFVLAGPVVCFAPPADGPAVAALRGVRGLAVPAGAPSAAPAVPSASDDAVTGAAAAAFRVRVR